MLNNPALNPYIIRDFTLSAPGDGEALTLILEKKTKRARCPACANHLPRNEMHPDAQSPLDQSSTPAEEQVAEEKEV
jgi:hypothetical protein